ncbi:hypothetical protein C8R44DRAFT_876476 [Mycena epipterygia]|nr:hypothetical protein C8R44DRAFT_876476 [Mycena epipterygia]
MPFSYPTLMCTLRELIVPRNDLEPERMEYDRHRSHKARYFVNEIARAVDTSSAGQADFDLGESGIIAATLSLSANVLARNNSGILFSGGVVSHSEEEEEDTMPDLV